MIIDAWAQHPTLRHMQDPIFESLRRWTKAPMPVVELPVSTTLAAMDQAAINKSLISAWVAPRNIMISNDEVAGFVEQAPDRLVGVGSVDISKPMAAVKEVRRCIHELGFKAIRILPWLCKDPSGTNYPMILPAKALEGFDTLSLDDEARELFLSGNARRVFKV